MDLSSLKAVEIESINKIFVIIPVLFAIIMILLVRFNKSGYLLDKYRGNIDPFILKFASIMSLVALIIIPFSSKHLISHDVKISVGVELNDTKYTKSVMDSILKKSGYNQYSSKDGYLSADKDGKIYYNDIISKKNFDDMKKDGTLNKKLKESYKEALEWHVENAIEDIQLKSENDENSLDSKYDNLTKEEKEKAMELYQKLKDEEANKTSKTPDSSEEETSDNSDITPYPSRIETLVDKVFRS